MRRWHADCPVPGVIETNSFWKSGHLPTLFGAFLCFCVCSMCWLLLGGRFRCSALERRLLGLACLRFRLFGRNRQRRHVLVARRQQQPCGCADSDQSQHCDAMRPCHGAKVRVRTAPVKVPVGRPCFPLVVDGSTAILLALFANP